MNFFFGPYLNDLIKQHDDRHMKFEEEKNFKWASIAIMESLE